MSGFGTWFARQTLLPLPTTANMNSSSGPTCNGMTPWGKVSLACDLCMDQTNLNRAQWSSSMKVVTSPIHTAELIYMMLRITTNSRQEIGSRTRLGVLHRTSASMTSSQIYYRLTSPRTLTYLLLIRPLMSQMRTLQITHQHISVTIAMSIRFSQRTLLITTTRRLSMPTEIGTPGLKISAAASKTRSMTSS